MVELWHATPSWSEFQEGLVQTDRLLPAPSQQGQVGGPGEQKTAVPAVSCLQLHKRVSGNSQSGLPRPGQL